MSGATELPPAMTVADFLAWDAPGGDRWELVDGIPRAMAPATPRHCAIQAEAARLIGNRLADLRSTCRVITEPGIQPRVRSDLNVRVPDLAVIYAARTAEETLLRKPLLVVEILSPSNHAQTCANIWSYTTIPSLWEILVLHTSELRADLLRRDEDGAWPADPLVLTLGDTVTLESIGFTTPVAAFYRTA